MKKVCVKGFEGFYCERCHNVFEEPMGHNIIIQAEGHHTSVGPIDEMKFCPYCGKKRILKETP